MIPFPVLIAFIVLIVCMLMMLGFIAVKTWRDDMPVLAGGVAAVMVIIACGALVTLSR
jgi:predicted exporter